MGNGEKIGAAEYLDRLFEVIREEAHANPEFAARLIRATGGEVTFPEKDKAVLLNPLDIAAREGAEGVVDQYASLDASTLRRVLKTHNLATPVDVRTRSKEDLLNMLAQRACERVASRSSIKSD
ncbi:MAG: hypothetical protein MRY64_06870 [Hyphomonadaceae bacterium]|nr:hypothetical protein [Hyphomonadaceae bacterium]